MLPHKSRYYSYLSSAIVIVQNYKRMGLLLFLTTCILVWLTTEKDAAGFNTGMNFPEIFFDE
jgi:hypothetical protein